MSTTSVSSEDDSDVGATAQVTETILENVRQALKGLRFGEITITVRDGNVVQIERVARRRQFKS